MVYSVGARQAGLRLDHFLKKRIPALSRRRVQQAIQRRVCVVRACRLAVSGGAPTLPYPVQALPSWLRCLRREPAERVRAATMVRCGDRVVIWPEEIDEPQESWAVPVLHQDAHLLAVDKPQGLVVHSTRRRLRNTLLGVLRRGREGENLLLAHRIDRETSGVVLLARDRDTARAVSEAFAAGRVRKTYLAVVRGVPEPRRGMIALAIGADRTSGIYVRRAVVPAGARAVTEYQVLCEGSGFSLLCLRPHTGRRHQIRVHLEAIKHPIVGDKLYGGDPRWYVRMLERGETPALREALLASRHLLHAAALELRHPADGRTLSIEAPLPADIREFLEARAPDLAAELPSVPLRFPANGFPATP